MDDPYRSDRELLRDFDHWRGSHLYRQQRDRDEFDDRYYIPTAHLSRYFILDEHYGETRPVRYRHEWEVDDRSRRRVVWHDYVRGYNSEIATEFMGINAQEGYGPPILFQTIVRSRDEDTRPFCLSFSSYNEAREGHKRIRHAVNAYLRLRYAERQRQRVFETLPPIQRFEASYVTEPADKLDFKILKARPQIFKPIAILSPKVAKPKPKKIVDPSRGLTPDERTFLELIDKRFALINQIQVLEKQLKPAKASQKKMNERSVLRTSCLKDLIKKEPLRNRKIDVDETILRANEDFRNRTVQSMGVMVPDVHFPTEMIEADYGEVERRVMNAFQISPEELNGNRNAYSQTAISQRYEPLTQRTGRRRATAWDDYGG